MEGTPHRSVRPCPLRLAPLSQVSSHMNMHSAPPWILAGWLFAAVWIGPPRPSRLPTRIGPPTSGYELLERGSVRELQDLERLGARRAQALVGERDLRGELPRLEDIPSIGPKTAAALRAYRSRTSEVFGGARPGGQGLPTSNGGERTPETSRTKTLQLGKDLRSDAGERAAGSGGRIFDQEGPPIVH